ncbi:M48 family metalloprotease [Actinoallomurus sp. CA-142502]|uniref:M48 family metalloprotease n=1 Tax=Actinoallomurus sp. CA-142502 TaxID=3239885 RepID=UPI003D8BE82F
MIGPIAVPLLAVVPALIGIACSPVATRFARHIHPVAATVLLTGLALTVSLATGLMLCLAAYLGTLELLPALHPHDWSVTVLHASIPIPAAAGMAAGALAVVLLSRACIHVARVVAGTRRTAIAAAALSPLGDLAIVDDDAMHAYAVPGRRQLIVVSKGLLRSLSGPQRRALLAHERTHLRYHHHLYAQLARLAASANPLIHPVARAVDGSLERWADAAAARAVGDPSTVAHALGVAALSRSAPPVRSLGAAHHDVVDRVRDLLEPPRRRIDAAVALAIATMLCWTSTAAVVLYVHRLIELAETVSR